MLRHSRASGCRPVVPVRNLRDDERIPNMSFRDMVCETSGTCDDVSHTISMEARLFREQVKWHGDQGIQKGTT